MEQPTSLQPAAKIIERLGGMHEVIRITGASRTRVYRWTQPVENGGTGGTIPLRHIPALLAAARKRNINLDANDFLPTPKGRARA